VEKDFSEWLHNKEKIIELNPAIEACAAKSLPLIELFTLIRLRYPEIYEDMFISVVSGILVTCTKDFDAAYVMIEKIKEIISKKEKEFNVNEVSNDKNN
jgi:hypothetical protein